MAQPLAAVAVTVVEAARVVQQRNRPQTEMQPEEPVEPVVQHPVAAVTVEPLVPVVQRLLPE